LAQQYARDEAELGWLKRDLAISGIVLTKLNDLNDRAQELVGFCFEVTQKTTGQYSNIYLNRLLSQEEVDKLPPRETNPR